MKVRSRFVPRRFTGKSAAAATRSMFSDAKSDERSPGCTPVYLNVYDLTPVNAYVYWAGFGIFHTGVQVHSVEYAFGAHDYATSGVFEGEPRECPGFKFRKSIYMGVTRLDPLEAREFMKHQSAYYTGDSYHLVVKNCNHFCDDMCLKLTGRRIPKWVNRLARIGCVCKCMLPETLGATEVQLGEAEQELSISSISLNSHYKGWLTSWEQTRTNE